MKKEPGKKPKKDVEEIVALMGLIHDKKKKAKKKKPK